jgi:hypothetical protein
VLLRISTLGHAYRACFADSVKFFFSLLRIFTLGHAFRGCRVDNEKLVMLLMGKAEAQHEEGEEDSREEHAGLLLLRSAFWRWRCVCDTMHLGYRGPAPTLVV